MLTENEGPMPRKKGSRPFINRPPRNLPPGVPQGLRAADDKAPPLDIRALGDGRVWLRINQAVDLPTAMKVLNMLGQGGSWT